MPALVGVRYTCGCADEIELTPIRAVCNRPSRIPETEQGSMMASMTQEQKIELIALNAQLGKMKAQGPQ